MNRFKTFAIRTLGCKLNQYESECIRQSLEKSGFEHRPFSDKNDFYLINTCTVTGKTDARCRNAIRRARKKNPDAVIIATGCYVQTSRADLEKMGAVDFLLDNNNKDRVHTMMENIRRQGTASGIRTQDLNTDKGFELLERFYGHSRAFIKIQEGCDAFCSYCIIPFARGRSRSIQPSRVLDQVKLLSESGYEEIVLTGIHIGRYGENEDFRMNLAGLIEMLLNKTKGLRFRLSSIEATEVTERLVSLFSDNDRIASHFHIPLQSGDNDILRLMNRGYTVSQFRDRILKIAGSVQNAAIGTDIIVGFPGEKNDHFRNTYQFLESEVPVNYFHVFPYSRRSGTKAASFPDKVRSEVKKERSRALIELGKRKREDFVRSQEGTSGIALVQGKESGKRDAYKALTGNYCEISVIEAGAYEGRLAPVKISNYSHGRLYGEISSL